MISVGRRSRHCTQSCPPAKVPDLTGCPAAARRSVVEATSSSINHSRLPVSQWTGTVPPRSAPAIVGMSLQLQVDRQDQIGARLGGRARQRAHRAPVGTAADDDRSSGEAEQVVAEPRIGGQIGFADGAAVGARVVDGENLRGRDTGVIESGEHPVPSDLVAVEQYDGSATGCGRNVGVDGPSDSVEGDDFGGEDTARCVTGPQLL